MERTTLFADILIPLSIKGYYTYRVPFELNNSIKTGQRVVVQFGKKKVYTGLVRHIHNKVPEYKNIKYILSILDIEAIVNEKQFQFWEWISTYYMCNYGEVMNAALPPAFKLASETGIVLSPEFDGDFSILNENEILVAEALIAKESLTVNEIAEITGLQKTLPLLKTLVEKKVIITVEEIHETYKPRIVSYIRLSEKYTDEAELKNVFDELSKRAFKQLQLLQTFLVESDFFNNFRNQVSKKNLLKNNFSDDQLKSLTKKGVFEIYDVKESRLEFNDSENSVSEIKLNELQQYAYESIKKGFSENKVVLLHGVTSSGKTEIYIKLIEDTLNKGKQVLYLLPEIAITAQIINRLRKFFGRKVGIYHSKFNENQRVEIWNKVNDSFSSTEDSKFEIIIGARSAVFLPFEKPGLIIVDEEHENSYKQYDPAPRYNARDAAVFLAKMHNSDIVLGSATPSLETFYNAYTGKYHLVEIKERFGGVLLPEILIADIIKESRMKTMQSHFTSLLIKNIDTALRNKKQIILFQNRRGFSLRLECDNCHYIPECKHCDVTLTYHKYNNQLKCHYCGYSVKIPEKCPQCESSLLLMKGFGTEKIEDELQLIFPDANIQRMDLDSTRSKNAYLKIITDFEDKKTDILVGTQMISKGLDFDNVSVVGILHADSLLNFPDFRSHERSFQLMAQVSGRAGRKGERGTVIIQTYNPEHIIIQQVVENDYIAMFKTQLNERKQFRYPPFYRLIEFTLKHYDASLLNQASMEFASLLRNIFDKRVLGPEFPLVSRVNKLYLKRTLLKIERDFNIYTAKEQIKSVTDTFRNKNEFQKIKIIINVDPL